jgi:Orsellinic acid/F9775 biosynthesis cluster protein D
LILHQKPLVPISQHLFANDFLKAHLLVINKTHHLLLCSACEVVVLPSQAGEHMKNLHDMIIRPATLAQLVAEVKYYSVAEVVPDRPTKVIDAIEGLAVTQSIQCAGKKCSFLSPVEYQLRRHQREAHKILGTVESNSMVPTQRFNNGNNKTYFHVTLPAPEPLNASIMDHIKDLKLVVRNSQKALLADEDVRNMAPWLRITRWSEHIKGHKVTDLRALVSTPSEYQGLREGLDHLFEKAASLFDSTPLLVLQRLNSPDPLKQ